MKFFTLLIIYAIGHKYAQSLPTGAFDIAEKLEDDKHKYLLMTIGREYELNRKPKWMIVYKNTSAKECVFQPVDDATADTLATALTDPKKKFSVPPHLDGLIIINDANVSSFCDGLSTRYLPKGNTNSTAIAKNNSFESYKSVLQL